MFLRGVGYFFYDWCEESCYFKLKPYIDYIILLLLQDLKQNKLCLSQCPVWMHVITHVNTFLFAQGVMLGVITWELVDLFF